MLLESVKKLNPLDRFLYWIRERHNIYARRKAGKPKPWTLDPILQSTYFTNVYRELDKTTAWCRQYVREPLTHDKAVIFAVLAFRWFNWIPTGELLLGNGGKMPNLLTNWEVKRAVSRLNVFKENCQVFTGAFNISNSGSSEPKINRVCEGYIQPAWEMRKDLEENVWGTSLKEAFLYLKKLPGLGGSGFMAAQIIADLKYTDALKDAEDWWTWCSPGPGSIRGLNILLGKDPESPMPPDFNYRVNNLAALIKSNLKMELHAQDVQNCLCELGKYAKVLEGGRAKRKYDAKA